MKTPAKPKETEEPAKEASASTPQVKKTPAKAKAVEEVPEQESQKTPVTKPKKVKTPSKVPEAEKTPVSKAKKEKTPAKPQGADEIALKEQEKTPASKSKKEKTPAKAKTPKDNLPKAADQSISEKTESTPAKSKPTPKAASQATQATPASKAKGEKTSKTPKSGKKSVTKAEPEQAKQQVPAEEAKDEAAAPEEDEIAFSEEELDEQTKTLVRTIDSGDEDEPGTGVILFAQGQDVGEIPAVSKKEKKAAKKALAALKEKEDTGVVYIGRLPHGFYEHEMKSYFSQFGPIRNLRVSRNKHTGKAKHFGFIEFEELSTAEIVAKTMDNYLLFGHILKCSVIPKAQVNSDLFKGANKRYKVRHPADHHFYTKSILTCACSPFPGTRWRASILSDQCWRINGPGRSTRRTSDGLRGPSSCRLSDTSSRHRRSRELMLRRFWRHKPLLRRPQTKILRRPSRKRPLRRHPRPRLMTAARLRRRRRRPSLSSVAEAGLRRLPKRRLRRHPGRQAEGPRRRAQTRTAEE